MEKLTLIQNELKVPKTHRNNFGKYMYRNSEDIMEALKPILLKHECSLFVSDEIIQVGERIYVKATVTIMDGDMKFSVSASARESLTKKGMDDSQITGTASSYARKYALNGLFLIDDTKDADFNNTSKEYTKPQPKAKIILTPESNKWAAALAAMTKRELSIEQVRKGYDITNDNFEILKEEALEIAFQETQTEINN